MSCPEHLDLYDTLIIQGMSPYIQFFGGKGFKGRLNIREQFFQNLLSEMIYFSAEEPTIAVETAVNIRIKKIRL